MTWTIVEPNGVVHSGVAVYRIDKPETMGILVTLTLSIRQRLGRDVPMINLKPFHKLDGAGVSICERIARPKQY
jgi:hypothetical protein